MPTHGIAITPGTCAICAKKYLKGASVYHDATKNVGKSVVHKGCWDELRRTRGPLPKKGKSEIVSSVPLDPPF